MMCSSGKATYPTRAVAKVVAKKLKRRGYSYLPKLRPYQCRECTQWHLTSKVNFPRIPDHHLRPEKAVQQ